MKTYIVTFEGGYIEVSGVNISDALFQLSKGILNKITQVTLKS